MDSIENALQTLRREKFVAIFRNLPLSQCTPALDALYRAGIRMIEVTFNPSLPDTVQNTGKIFSLIREKYPDIHLAAGTVVKAEYVQAAKEFGAEIIVSPQTDEKIITLTHSLGMLSIPGAFTPTEIVQAYNLGADVVKIFPIEPHNISYLKNILAPLSHIPFLPTGGVNPDTAPEFMKLGATALAAGASILKPDLLAAGDYGAIEELARRHLVACRGE